MNKIMIISIFVFFQSSVLAIKKLSIQYCIKQSTPIIEMNPLVKKIYQSIPFLSLPINTRLGQIPVDFFIYTNNKNNIDLHLPTYLVINTGGGTNPRLNVANDIVRIIEEMGSLNINIIEFTPNFSRAPINLPKDYIESLIIKMPTKVANFYNIDLAASNVFLAFRNKKIEKLFRMQTLGLNQQNFITLREKNSFFQPAPVGTRSN